MDSFLNSFIHSFNYSTIHQFIHPLQTAEWLGGELESTTDEYKLLGIKIF